MDENIQRFMEGIKVGAKQSHKNMTLFCLLAAHEAETGFVTLDEALEKGSLSITETDEAGNVPELRVANKSHQNVLLLDGEELVGAKQNRVLNVTVLIGPKTETVIPVSCVEQGRWSYRSNEFRSEARAMSPRLKRRKTESVTVNLDMEGSYASDQSMVWDEIDAKYERMAVPASQTGAMADLYESQEDRTKEYVKAFHPVDNQIGIAVFIDGRPAGIEILAKFDAFRKTHGKMVSSYVMDALETAPPRETTRREPSKTTAMKTLEAVRGASVQRRKSVALGEDIRLDSKDLIGAGIEFEGQVLQMSMFLNEREDRVPSRTRMRRASARRNSLR